MTNGYFAYEKGKKIRMNDMIINRDSRALIDNGLNVLYISTSLWIVWAIWH